MKRREWWIVQTALSYTIGEPVYRVETDEPSELTKRTSVNIHKSVELKPDERVISKAELFAAYTLAAKRHFNPQSEKDHGTLPCLIWQELELLFGAEGE